MINPDLFQKAIWYAAKAHQGQTVPGTQLPYLTHLSQVVSEVWACWHENNPFDIEKAVLCAWLHDVLEDTPAKEQELQTHFGQTIATGVKALTKNPELPHTEQMGDSLTRIVAHSPEVCIVKMADRITNLQAPPAHWQLDKRQRYQEEAKQIWEALHQANLPIAKRLQAKIDAYSQYLV